MNASDNIKIEGFCSAEEDGFEIKFPTTYTRKVHSILPLNLKQYTVIYQCSYNHRLFTVSVTYLQEYYGSPFDLLNQAVKMLLTNIDGGVLYRKKAYKTNSLPSLRYLITKNIDNLILIPGFMYLINDRLYNISGVTINQFLDEFTTFASTFKLIT